MAWLNRSCAHGLAPVAPRVALFAASAALAGCIIVDGDGSSGNDGNDIGDDTTGDAGTDDDIGTEDGMSGESGTDDTGTDDGTDDTTTGPGGTCQDGDTTPGEPCYGAAVPLDDGVALGAVAIGDLDGDGHLDVVAGGETDLRVYLGDGQGGFAPLSPVPLSAAALALGAVDVTGDARDDVFVTTDDAQVHVFVEGTPLGNSTPFMVGDEPRGLLVAPIDADGNDDLAVANAGDGTVTLLTGDGSGNFNNWDELTVGGTPWSLATGTFASGSGNSLVVADAGSDVVSLLTSNGTGFDDPVGLGVGLHPVWVAVADFDGDTIPDIGSLGEGSDEFVWLAGLDNGSFDAGQSLGLGPSPRDGVTGDLDGDGTLDVAAVSRESGRVDILLSDADGGFFPRQSVMALPTPRAIAAGDLNEDGVTDLAVVGVGNAGGLVVLLSDI